MARPARGDEQTPSDVSAKLAPKDPDAVAARLSAVIRERVPEPWRSTFAGTIVMDTNDIGRNALGADMPDADGSRFQEIFADNPNARGSRRDCVVLGGARRDRIRPMIVEVRQV
ncbi:MAG: hypothetical protein ACRCYX_04055 [Dermatophilaceae bacterium]